MIHTRYGPLASFAAAALVFANPPTVAADVPDIIPLGDSITYGSGAAGGYRTKLYQQLHAVDFDFRFIGSSTENSSDVLRRAKQTAHEGHPGYRIDQIAGNLDGNDGTGGNNGGYWFTGTDDRDPVYPEFVLLHIGTNDIAQGYDRSHMAQRLDDLVTQIVSDRPDAWVLVAGIIPINLIGYNSWVISLNKTIETQIVPKHRDQGDRVAFVDQYANFIDENGHILGNLLPDGVHPNQEGYDRMGQTWSDAVLAIPEPGSFALLSMTLTALTPRRRG